MFRISNYVFAYSRRSRLSSRIRAHHVSRDQPVVMSSACHLVFERHHGTAASASILNTTTSPDTVDSFLHGGAANYIDEMYSAWRRQPQSVHVSWHAYFRGMEDASTPASKAFQPPPGLLSSRDHNMPLLHVPRSDTGADDVKRHLKVQQIVRAYQTRGHYHARTDPLGLRTNAEHVDASHIGADPSKPNEFQPSYYGFTENDLEATFELGPGILPRFASNGRQSMTLREIIAACESTYCGSVGVEYLHIPDRARCEWLRERIEKPLPIAFSKEEKGRILDGLLWGTSFERFLAAKFPNEKRFGLDGAETLVPGVMSLIDRCADAHGVENIVIGSCHRGRLTMLGTVYGKAREAILAEFAGRVRHDMVRGMAGDVKYHLGHDGERITSAGCKVSISLLANPSHLEAVDPVATGKAYATQKIQRDEERKKVMCLSLHGDAAFAGQGVVYETLGLSRLAAYEVGGTVRLIVNNQIGFTTDAHCSRSTPYPTDLAKFVDAPILHVNADDPEAVTWACQLAADWRAEYQQDIVIDLVCYRRLGHNEIDQPTFTQPMMYQKVLSQTASLEMYIDKLIAEGTFTAAEIEAQKQWVWDRLNENFESSKGHISERQHFLPAWKDLPEPGKVATQAFDPVSTTVDRPVLNMITTKVNSVPAGFDLHKNLQRILAGRKMSFEDDAVDWSTAEALALGSLLIEGHPVRLTGQDVQRGTFSQRHAVLHDQTDGRTWTPLQNLSEKQANFTAANSPLSEFGALGFEYGVTLADPASLVMWEAQFGDFVNNTQVIIDNFIFAGESKWLDRSGLVMSLPHGFDGQGAEHSSARLERFLMLCNGEGRVWPEETDLERLHQDCNVEVVYMTTPANYFHVLRRQLKREYRKPLIVFFSKSLLRHHLTRSSVSSFTDPNAVFQPVLPDPDQGTPEVNPPGSISRVIICSGQVYATLAKHRALHPDLRDTAITRIEELHPFPWRELKANLTMYPNAKTIVWSQEEHYNGGAWHYMRDRINATLQQTEAHKAKSVLYVGRGPSASAATGSKKLHEAEEKTFVKQAFRVTQ